MQFELVEKEDFAEGTEPGPSLHSSAWFKPLLSQASLDFSFSVA